MEDELFRGTPGAPEADAARGVGFLARTSSSRGLEVTVTGHRSLPGESSRVKEYRRAVADNCLADFKPWLVRTGMAQGWDQDIAWGCCLPDERYNAIPFDAYIPCAYQERLWPSEARQEYGQLLATARQMIHVSTEAYRPELMHRRNEAMLDDTPPNGLVLALWDGREKGGTYSALRYAQRRRPTVRIVNVWPSLRGYLDGLRCHIYEGDMWMRWRDVDLWLFTANSQVGGTAQDRFLVMGAGIAKDVKTYFPAAPESLAREVLKRCGNLGEYGLLLSPNWPAARLGALQTKFRAVELSSPSLIKSSLARLADWAEENPDKRVAVNFPGIGHGGLDVAAVWPLLEVLPSNVEVWASPGHLVNFLR